MSGFHLCLRQVWCGLSDSGVQRRHGGPGLQPYPATLHLPVRPAAVQLCRCPPDITAHLPLSWLHEGTGGAVQRLPIAASRHQWGWQDLEHWMNMKAASQSMWGFTHLSVSAEGHIDHIYCFLAAAWNVSRVCFTSSKGIHLYSSRSSCSHVGIKKLHHNKKLFVCSSRAAKRFKIPPST